MGIALRPVLSLPAVPADLISPADVVALRSVENAIGKHVSKGKLHIAPQRDLFSRQCHHRVRLQGESQ